MERRLTHAVLVVVPQRDLAARVAAAVVEETLKELAVQIRTPERAPSPADACVTEEELFHRMNPKVTSAV